MKRRDFLKVTGIGAAGAATMAAPAIAQSMPEIKWRLTASWPKSLDTLWGGVEMMAKLVAEATDNKFQLQMFAGGEIVPGLQVLDAVQNGTVEMGHTASYYYFGKDPTFAFGTAVPFGPNQRLNQAWYMHGGGRDVSAIGIAGIVRLADAGHQMLRLAAIGDRRREGQKEEVAAGHEGIGQPVVPHRDLDVAGERGFAHLSQHADVEKVILAEPGPPRWKVLSDGVEDAGPDVELHAMSLAIIEADRLHAFEAVERPGQAGRRVLPARKQNQGGALVDHFSLRNRCRRRRSSRGRC